MKNVRFDKTEEIPGRWGMDKFGRISKIGNSFECKCKGNACILYQGTSNKNIINHCFNCQKNFLIDRVARERKPLLSNNNSLYRNRLKISISGSLHRFDSLSILPCVQRNPVFRD